MKRGEIWWVEFDPLVGSEIRKTRPAVIVSNDAANRNLARVVVIPLTSNVSVHTLASLIHDGHHPHHEKTFFLHSARQET